MGRHTIDVPATLTLHVTADSRDEAMAKVRAYGVENPDVTIADGVVVHELGITAGKADYVHGDLRDEGDDDDWL